MKLETKSTKRDGKAIEEFFEEDVLISRTMDGVEQDLQVSKRGSKISLRQDKLEPDENSRD